MLLVKKKNMHHYPAGLLAVCLVLCEHTKVGTGEPLATELMLK